MEERVIELGQEHGCSGDVQMWTLTLDPKRWSSPQEAWEWVGEHRRVGEMMRRLGVRYYVVVLEWHRSGWPHWHVLIWEPVERMRLEYRAALDAWGLGIVRYSCRWRDEHGRWRQQPKPIEWAVRYVTKYLCKAKEDAPAWVAEKHHVRMIWASRAWGSVVGRGLPSELEADPEDEAGEGVGDRDWRTNEQALADCGRSARLMLEWLTPGGEVRRKYLGETKLAWRDVKRATERLACGRLGRRVSVAFAEGSAEWARLRRVLLPGSGTVPLALLS
jgi:hypothetical protein